MYVSATVKTERDRESEEGRKEGRKRWQKVRGREGGREEGRRKKKKKKNRFFIAPGQFIITGCDAGINPVCPAAVFKTNVRYQ